MFRRTARSCALVIAAALVASTAAACRSAASVHESHQRFEHDALPPVEITLRLPRWQQRDETRAFEAVRTALRLFGEWYGPYGQSSLTVRSDGAANPGDVPIGAPIVSRAAGRLLEREIGAGIARRFWPAARTSTGAATRALRNAIVAYSVDRMLRETYADGYATELRFFDGLIPWVVKSVPPVSLLADQRAGLALLTLERYLGWPVLQQTLAEVRARTGTAPATAAELIAAAGEIAGRDLQWMIPLFDPATVYDYAVDRIDTAAVAGGSHRTVVAVGRHGNGIFAGTTRPRTSAFEEGRGVSLTVTFDDGQQLTETWDGRDAERRFVFEGPSTVRSAMVDPDGVIAVDAAPANNVWSAATPTENAALFWTSRWALWLQDRLLLWSALL